MRQGAFFSWRSMLQIEAVGDSLIVLIPDAGGKELPYRLSLAGGTLFRCTVTKLEHDAEGEVLPATPYTVRQNGTRLACDCKAYRYRGRWGRESCKHCDKMKELKVILELLERETL